MVDTRTANEQGRKFIYTYIYLSPVILLLIKIPFTSIMMLILISGGINTDVMWQKDMKKNLFHVGLNILHNINKEDRYQTVLPKNKVQSGFIGVVNLIHSTTIKSWGNSCQSFNLRLILVKNANTCSTIAKRNVFNW